ncbi:hypothetical protein PybrP1_009453 [[Pythium] brassicae (nom. inval.)]|nr:hypothetical protein PybrP1_009453 [[Pythium] brassicae (nom. inval.)]
MQDIMDEALAMRLYEEDCRAFEQELNAAHVSANAFAHMQQSRDARNRDAQLLGAHSSADYEDYEEYYEEAAEAEPRDHTGAATAAGVSPPAATPSSAKPAAAMAASLILQKLINRGELDAVHGAVRGGKETRVYFAVGTDERTQRIQEI